MATQGSGRVRRKSVVRGGWKKRERDRYASKGEVDEKQLLSKKRCKPKRGYRCSGCQKNGHSLAHCPHKANPTPHLCCRCKQPGHNARTCVGAVAAPANGARSSTAKASRPQGEEPAPTAAVAEARQAQTTLEELLAESSESDHEALAEAGQAQTQLEELLAESSESDHEALASVKEKQLTLTQLGVGGTTASESDREGKRDNEGKHQHRPCRLCGSFVVHSIGTRCPFIGKGTFDEQFQQAIQRSLKDAHTVQLSRSFTKHWLLTSGCSEDECDDMAASFAALPSGGTYKQLYGFAVCCEDAIRLQPKAWLTDSVRADHTLLPRDQRIQHVLTCRCLLLPGNECLCKTFCAAILGACCGRGHAHAFVHQVGLRSSPPWRTPPGRAVSLWWPHRATSWLLWTIRTTGRLRGCNPPSRVCVSVHEHTPARAYLTRAGFLC